MQYLEGLTDRQTADSVRSRIDWKYLLCLELTDVGFHHTVLSEFRTRLVTEEAERLIFEKLLTLCLDKGWLKPRTRQRTDSTHVLAAIRAVTRLECAGETFRATLTPWPLRRQNGCGLRANRNGLSDTVNGSKTITCPSQKASEKNRRYFMAEMAFDY